MSSSNATPQLQVPPRVASSPFDKSTADLILRTSDHVQFRVHSQILKIASPAFEAILSLPHTPENRDQNIEAECPIMDVSEDMKTLDILLRICYPIEQDQRPQLLDETERALKAAMKYEMARPVEVLTENIKLSASSKPFGAWAAACRLGSEQLARHAANVLCSTDVDTRFLECPAGPSAGDYHRLREYLNGTRSPRAPLLTSIPSPTTNRPSDTASTGRSPAVNIEQMPFPDLVCRSSDGVCFEVHRGIVAAASPRLHEMITSILPDCSSASPDLPVLPLDERSSTLATLLRMCYCSATVELPAHPKDYAALVRAADKYSMDRIRHKLQRKWAVVCRPAPLDAYFAAAGAEWKEGAAQAARYVPWQYPHSEMELPYTAAMEDAPAIAYQRLILYHRSFRRGVLGVLWEAPQGYRDFLIKNTAFGPERHVDSKCCDEVLALLEAVEQELPRQCHRSHGQMVGLSRLHDITLRAQRNLEKVDSELHSSVILNHKLSTMKCLQVDFGL